MTISNERSHDKLLNLKQAQNSSNVRELRELHDSCEIQTRNLNYLGVIADSYGHLLCHNLLKLIPPEIALNFNRKKADGEKNGTRRAYLFFIKKEVQSREITMVKNSEKNFNGEKEKI